MSEYTVMVVSNEREVLDAILIPTAHVTERDKKDLIEIASGYKQRVTFLTKGWMGIEAAKFRIHEMNGDIGCPGCDACTPRGKHGWVNDECALKAAKEKG